MQMSHVEPRVTEAEESVKLESASLAMPGRGKRVSSTAKTIIFFINVFDTSSGRAR